MLPDLFGNYNKFIYAAIGAGVGALFSWLATKGIGSCVGEGDTQVCTVFGLDQVTATGFIVGIVSSLGTYMAPPNRG